MLIASSSIGLVDAASVLRERNRSIDLLRTTLIIQVIGEAAIGL